jgi:phage-related protein
MKRLLALALATAVAAGSLGVTPAEAYTDPNLGSNKIGRVGNATKSIYKGGELDLEVRKGTGLRENDIKWSISNTNILRFDDDDRYDDEIEVKALKTGTTKVTAKNLVTGGKIVYTVKVKASKNTISRVGNKDRNVKVGNEFELRVKKNGNFSDSNLYWTTSNSKVVKIADDDRYDDEIELRALKAGTAKITCKNALTGGKLVYNVTVKEGSGTISRVGSSSRTIEVGDDAELKVKKSGLTNSQIKWSVSDSSILRFEDGDNIGTEVEVEGKKVGTAKVYAKNLKTGGKITYTIKVVPDYDDDWDDDDK